MSIVHPRIVMVSNRLPIRLAPHGDTYEVKESPGGLVRALGAVMRRRGGVWIGWPGVPGEVDLDEVLESDGVELGYPLKAVPITSAEHELFYKGFANEVIWPLFHDLHTYCRFDERYWQAYKRINRRFAEHILHETGPDDLVWIHDYHLMRTAKDLREMGSDARLGFFLHIPFPGPDIFRRLPWREEVLAGLLEHDVLGFQTQHDLENFVQTVRALRNDVMVRRPERSYEIHTKDRIVRAGTFPIGIDVDDLRTSAAAPAVEERLAALREQHRDQTIILGVDRLDYTKGIPARLDAFEHALRTHPELQKKVTLIQHVAPSREEVASYDRLKRVIERRIGEINGEFGAFDWTPVHYLYNTLDFHDLLALYRLARVALITPLKDGMNLVSMEYCAVQDEDAGVLILSEFAGAAQGAKHGALIVNPHDTKQVAEAIVRAVHMPGDERDRRLVDLMDAIENHDVFRWVDSFLEAGFADVGARTPYTATDHLASTHP